MTQVGQPPEKGRKREIAEAVGEALVASVPVAGGALAVAYVKVLGAAYEKRQLDWARAVTAALANLSEKVEGLTPESLAENDRFLDALAHASSVAAATGQQEKLDALRNAVLNAALPSGIDADTQAIFLRHVRDLTPSHLRMLRLLDDPELRARARETAFWRQVQSRREFYLQIDRDLSAAGLAGANDVNVMMNDQVHLGASETGKAFLKFITDPRDALD